MKAVSFATGVAPFQTHQKRSQTEQTPMHSAAPRFGATLLQDLPYVVDLSAPIVPKTVQAATEALQVMALKKRLTQDPGSIKLVVNSPGGSVTDGFKLIGTVKQLDVPVDTIVMGIAASMGAIISMAAASKGRRFMDRYAKLMIHQPSVSNVGGTSEEIANYSREIERTRNIIDGLVSQHTGLPIPKIRELTSKDSFVMPLRALKDNFVDFVLISGDKGLNRDAIKHLTDADIAHRDEYNMYDDLKPVTIDAKSAAPKARIQSGGGGGLGSILGGGGGPQDKLTKSKPPSDPQDTQTISPKLIITTGEPPITRKPQHTGGSSPQYPRQLEIIA